MFIGIIILCLPAAARSCRHHSNAFQMVKSCFLSKTQPRSFAPRPPTKDHFQRENIGPSNGPYPDLNGCKTSSITPFAKMKRPYTVITTGNRNDIDEDGIELTYEMRRNDLEEMGADIKV